MVALQICLLLLCSCPVGGDIPRNQAWPDWLVNQGVDVTVADDAPERQLFLPMLAAAAVAAVEATPAVGAGLLGAFGLSTAEIGAVLPSVGSLAVNLLTGSLASEVVDFAGSLLSTSGVLTTDGGKVAHELHASHKHRHDVSGRTVIDVQDFLGIQLNEAQQVDATEHMANKIASGASDFVEWWGQGMKQAFVGGHTMKPMKATLNKSVHDLFSLSMGRTEPVATWMTSPLPMMCILASLGGSLLAAVMRMWHQKCMPCREHVPFGLVDDVALME